MAVLEGYYFNKFISEELKRKFDNLKRAKDIIKIRGKCNVKLDSSCSLTISYDHTEDRFNLYLAPKETNNQLFLLGSILIMEEQNKVEYLVCSHMTRWCWLLLIKYMEEFAEQEEESE